MNRRQFFRSIGTLSAGAALLPYALRDAIAGHLAGSTVRIGTAGGTWRDSLDKLVGSRLREHGANVEFVIGSASDQVSKMIASRGRTSPIDIAMSGSPEFYQDLVREGMIEKLVYDRIPNAMALPQWARLSHAVMPFVAFDGIAYNTEKFAEAGIPEPQHYSDLTNPKLKGRVAFPDIGHVEHWNAVVGLAYDAGGNETTMDKAAALVNEIAPNFYFAASTDLSTKISLGEVWAAPWHAGWVLRLRRAGLPLAHVNPKIGTTGKVGALWPVYNYIPVNAENKLGAETYINFLLTPEIQLSHGITGGVAPVEPSALGKFTEIEEVRAVLHMNPKEVDNAFLIDWEKLDSNAWRETWNRGVKR